ncbi:hypothetical protein G6F61_009644 [Rhizopus arrhizus]|nr:hypothetical protein G6F61_009644 [Rhizopus arrhizus]
MGLGATVVFRAGEPQQFSYNSTKALAIMLRRLAYPSRLINFLQISRWNSLQQKALSSFNLRLFNNAIVAKGSCYDDVVGFIDGTLIAMCRPSDAQESVYNGHVRQHGLKYQAIVIPEWKYNELEVVLDCTNIDGKQYAIYGDPASRQSMVLIQPIPTTLVRSSEKRELNKIMATVRECVEWEFGHVSTLFGFLKFRQGQKLGLSRVGIFYVVATLMKNIHVCVNRGNQTSMFFGIMAPTLEQYVSEITPSKF